ncbi:MAG: periplasmic heavy metal sensor [Ferruginibacter sp.]
MNTQPKNKVLIIIIGILLIANIVTLSLFLLNKQEHSRPGRPDKKAQVTAFLKKEVGFTEDQLVRYDTISNEHRSKLKTVFDDMAEGREQIFQKLSADSFNDSAIDVAANAIADQQKGFEIIMLSHLKDIRNICTPAQRAVFDTGFYKIIAKRGEGRRDNKKQ